MNMTLNVLLEVEPPAIINILAVTAIVNFNFQHLWKPLGKLHIIIYEVKLGTVIEHNT